MKANRSCGECTACCVEPAIDTPELRKLPRVPCTHCTGTGCAIYAARPPVCRTHFCGWFVLGDLGEEWRPDRSGVLISPCAIGIPAHYRLREGIEFLVFGGEEAVRRPAFTAFLTHLIRSGVPSFIAVPGPAGHFPARTFLNDNLARMPPPAYADAFVSLLKAAKGHRFEPMPQFPLN
jgi:hypothetical protein